MNMFSEALIKLEKLTDAHGGEQKRNCQARRVGGQEQNGARDGVAARGQQENSRENRTDAGRPAKRKREPQQKSAPDARLLGRTADVNVAIEPTREARSKETDWRE